MSRPRRPGPVHDLDWSADRARAFADRAVDLWESFLRQLPELPVSQPQTAEEVRNAIALEVPEEPMADDALFAHLEEIVLRRSMYPGHAGFHGYISGAGTVPGAPADLLAAGINQNLGGWRLAPAAVEVERQLVAWFTKRLGLPEGSGGFLTSGGAMANFIALAVARSAKSGFDVRRAGIRGGPQLAVYASTEVHDTIDRACDMLGIGSDFLRKQPTRDDYTVDVEATRAAIERDLAAGLKPLAIVATAGTVATGAIDSIERMGELADEFDLWLHVDGAYGGTAALVESIRPQFAGIERADSIGFDPHKWLYTPHSGGCILLRDEGLLEPAFAVESSYTHEDKQLTGRGADLHQRSPLYSRSFAAMKVWVSLLAHGWNAYERRIAHDCELARYLFDLADERSDMEAFGPQGLSIACWRYAPPDLDGHPGREPYLDLLNERLMYALQDSGKVYPSNAVLEGHFVLRACVVNFRTEAEEMEAEIELTAEHGRRLDGELRSRHLR